MYPPNKQPVGFYHKQVNFTQKEIPIYKGDRLYFFSNGFEDQFGGERNKKYKTKPFKNLLIDTSNSTMDRQKVEIEEVFTSWQGDNEQVDDMCLIGVEIA